MKDIKELALKIADSLDPTAGKGCGKNYILTPNNVAELCTRFLAAYTEGQEPVAWDGAEEWEQLAWNLCAEEGGEESCTELLWDGGPIPEPWGDRWLKYEGEAKRMISLVRKFTAPPEPAPSEFSAEQRDKDWSAINMYGRLAHEIATEALAKVKQP